LLPPDETARVKNAVAEAAGNRAKMIATAEGRIDANVALGLEAGAENDIASRRSHHDTEDGHDHDDFDTFVIDIPPLNDADAYIRRLGDVSSHHDVLRIKGFLDVAGKPMRLLVQGVGSRFRQHYDRPWSREEARQGRLVVIGQKGLDRAAIAAALG
jgi:cobalamin biosynthesis protein CobW